ncbi:MAG TPA: GAF domain-containing protein [Methylomirabilota bacterium]|nr:GAF domain-containing protein [Methylomirabilota bacterium]
MAVVCAERDGLELLERLLGEPGFTIAVVADSDPDAPAARLARRHEISVVTGPLDVFRHPVDLVVDATERPEMREALRVACPAGVEVVGSVTARVLGRLTERRHQEAIRHAQVVEDAMRSSRAFESLAHITRSIVGSLEASQVFASVVEGAAHVLGADAATLSVFDHTSETLTVGADFGFRHGAWRKVKRWRLGEGLVGWVAQQLTPVFLPNFADDPRVQNKAWARTEGLFAYGAVPLRVAEGRLVGVLTVFYRRPRAFAEEEQKLLLAFGDLAAVAIVNARLYEDTVRRGAELDALLRATRSVMAGLDLKVILERIVEEAGRIAGTPYVTVLLVDEEAGVLRAGAVSGAAVPAGFQVPLGAGYSGTVARTGQPLVIADTREDPHNLLAARDREAGITTYLGLPIQIRDEILGVLTFNTTHPRQYGPADLAFLASFADQAAIAIENARLYADLQRALEAVRASQERQIRSERFRALGEMASGIAHDFNNMLAGILGRAQLLLRDVQDPKIRRGLEIIEKLAQDGASTVRRIQEVSRVRRRPAAGHVRINELVADALELTRARWENEAQATGRTYRVATNFQAIPPVLAEASELREVFLNLFLNAFDAMPDGGELRVSTRLVGGRIEVRVSDTGTGMTEEARRRAFEPFFTTKGPQSSGLGLAMAYGIIGRHDGGMEIDSRLGEGTTIILTLPAADEAPPTDRVESASLPAPRLRVLLIEDEEEVREVIQEALTAWGHSLLTAADGTEGMRLARTGEYDLVLTDVSLPGYSGWKLAEAVRARGSAVPILFVTGWGDQLDPVHLAALGRVEILSKPFRLEDLSRLLGRLAGSSTTH